MALLLKDPELAGKLGEEGRRFAQTYFSWERIAAALIAEYGEAIEAAAGPKPR